MLLLTNCIMVDSSTVICWMSPYVILGVLGLGFFSLFFYFLWKILFGNNVVIDQTPHYMESDLGLHCLPMTLI